MYKYLTLTIFVTVFFFLIKKDRAYVVPFILLAYSNINGLLDWEDFALQGVIKFQDYGLIITFLFLIRDRFIKKASPLEYELDSTRSTLYWIILSYWGYYFFEFIYSIIIQGGIEWPIKMGRHFLYGIVFFIIYSEIKKNPIFLFEKIINSLMQFTLLFGLMYVTYNLFGFDFYPKEAHEEFTFDGIDAVKRNFSGFPTFTYYFIILFVHKLMLDKKFNIINLLGLFLLVSCVFFSLTRGMIILTASAIALTILLRQPSVRGMRRLVTLSFIAIIATPILLNFAESHLAVLMLRFDEFTNNGFSQSNNFLVRSIEFSRIVDNVIDFNLFLGFGFTNISLLGLGYQSNVLHGGSADNGYSNLIGTTGFIGLTIFLLLMFFWLRINIKLQALQKEPYSKVNFIYIVFMLASFFDGSSMSYMHAYALFLAYDLLAYSYLKRSIKSVGVQPIPPYTSKSRLR